MPSLLFFFLKRVYIVNGRIENKVGKQSGLLLVSLYACICTRARTHTHSQTPSPFVLSWNGCPLIYKKLPGRNEAARVCSRRLVPVWGKGMASTEFDRCVTVAFQLTPNPIPILLTL